MKNWISLNCLLCLIHISIQFDFKNPEVDTLFDKNKFEFNFEYKVSDFVTEENIQKNLLNKKQKLKFGNLDSGISQEYSKKFQQIQVQNFTDDSDAYDYNGHGTFTMSVCQKAFDQQQQKLLGFNKKFIKI